MCRSLVGFVSLASIHTCKVSCDAHGGRERERISLAISHVRRTPIDMLDDRRHRSERKAFMTFLNSTDREFPLLTLRPILSK